MIKRCEYVKFASKMSFQNPSFLWALLLLAVPLIIHLFNFRRYKRVKFSNVEMLEELESESRKTRHVKKWLILASRMLALACLVLAFALPFLPNKGNSGGRTLISLYLDNSQSMNSIGEDGQIFENAKNLARELLSQLSNNADVQFIDNGLSPYSNRLFSPQQVVKLVDDISLDFVANDLLPVIEKAKRKALTDDYSSHHFIGISDFQKSQTFKTQDADTSSSIYLVRMEAEAIQNISIDSAWISDPISRPGSPVKLKVKVTNNGKKDVESSTITLTINGVQQGLESFEILKSSTKEISMEFSSAKSGWVVGQLSVADVPVVFDNDYYFSIFLKERLNVLNVGEESASVNQIFKNDKTFSLINAEAGRVDYSALKSYDFIILNELDDISSGLTEQLKGFVEQAGVLFVIPSTEASNYASFSRELSLPTYIIQEPRDLSVSVESLSHPFMRDVYRKSPRNQILPTVKKSFSQAHRPSTDKILRLKDGTVVLSRSKLGLGNVFMLGMPLGQEYSTYTDHELFVLSILKMSFTGNANTQIAYNLQNKEPIEVPVMDADGALTLKLGNKEMVMESAQSGGTRRIWLNEEVEQAGVYSLENSKGELLAKIGLNYNRSESPQKFYSNEDLNDLFAGSPIQIYEGSMAQVKTITNQLSSGTQLWKMFILLSLLFLLIEVLLLRFIKT